jgi:hypothetical protein
LSTNNNTYSNDKSFYIEHLGSNANVLRHIQESIGLSRISPFLAYEFGLKKNKEGVG